GMARRFSLPVEWVDESTLRARAHRTLQLAHGFPNVPKAHVRDRYQAPQRVGAEIDNPAVVRAAVRTGELRIFHLRLPQDADRRIEYRGAHPLVENSLDTLLRLHGAERSALHVGTIRAR